MAAKYLLIARRLEQNLRQSAETKLPTEAELSRQFDCSRQTVRTALKILEEKGLIVKRRGSGSYPTHAAPKGNRIAILLADKEEYTAPDLLRGIRKAAGEMGFGILCLETGGDRKREREHLTRLLEQKPAGILLEPICDLLGCFNEDLLTQLKKAGIPLVYLNGRYAFDAPCVRHDDPAAAAVAAAHLAASGHRQIAAIWKSDDSQGVARYRGSVFASQEMDLTLNPENCLWFSEQERQRLLDGADSLLRRFLLEYRGSCSAVICHNDEIAYRLLRLLRREEIHLAVVSFDNSSLAREASITSLGSDGDTMGAEAVRTLALLMDGKEAADVTLPRILHVRKSG